MLRQQLLQDTQRRPTRFPRRSLHGCIRRLRGMLAHSGRRHDRQVSGPLDADGMVALGAMEPQGKTTQRAFSAGSSAGRSDPRRSSPKSGLHNLYRREMAFGQRTLFHTRPPWIRGKHRGQRTWQSGELLLSLQRTVVHPHNQAQGPLAGVARRQTRRIPHRSPDRRGNLVPPQAPGKNLLSLLFPLCRAHAFSGKEGDDQEIRGDPAGATTRKTRLRGHGGKRGRKRGTDHGDLEGIESR